jgi:hypothetical protein
MPILCENIYKTEVFSYAHGSNSWLPQSKKKKNQKTKNREGIM